MDINDVYEQAVKFVNEKQEFKGINPNNRRISVLAVMKMICELQK